MTLDDIRGRATITVDETASVLDMGLRQTYAAIRDGSLPSLRLSRRILVPVPALLRLLGDIEGEDGQVGAQLVLEAIAYSNTANIDYAPRCLLLWMAVRALDDASATPDRPARLSFMSRAQLGVGMGKFMPDREPGPDASAEEHRKWNADQRAIGRAVESLKASGAIVEVERGRNGWNATYLIDLGRRSASTFPTLSVHLPAPASTAKRRPSSDAERRPSRR